MNLLIIANSGNHALDGATFDSKMSMKIISEVKSSFPFSWVNLESYPDSDAFRVEIYLKDKRNMVEELALLFFSLFGSNKDDIYVYDSSWWDFCLDTWEINKDEYNYHVSGKSEETKSYLTMLSESGISQNYSGSCECENWEVFLQIILECIISHIAPYSPIFYCEKFEVFFYFHHSGSIGFYFKDANHVVVESILRKAKEEYEVKG